MEEKQKQIVQSQTEHMSKADEEFLNGTPTRHEVANYVNALFEEKYMPAIMKHFSQLECSVKLSITALQKILIQKGICTDTEIGETLNALVEEYKSEFIKKYHEDTSNTKLDNAESTE